MINLHLLTEVSGYDAGFRLKILTMIELRFERVRERTTMLTECQRWTACYLYLEQYLHDLQTYTELSALNRLKHELKLLKRATDPLEKERLSKCLLNDISKGLQEARSTLSVLEAA